MTGYGEAALLTPLGRFKAEITSLNRRHFELICNLPKECSSLEPQLKGLFRVIERGRVELRLKISYSSSPELTIDKAFIAGLKRSWDEMAPELGYSPGYPLPVELLANQPSLWEDLNIRSSEELWETVSEVVSKAIDQLISAKKAEGLALCGEMSAQCHRMKTQLVEVERRAPSSAERYRDQLWEKMQRWSVDLPVDEERLHREVCLFADRVDVTEELIRLSMHLKELERLLNDTVHPVGKRLEFLLQEVGREVNTLCAKSQDGEMTHALLEMKATAEKIREQVQNVE